MKHNEFTVSNLKAAREFAVEVVRQLKAAGYHAVWAGGCVRDQLMQRTPKDYDVATDARPDQVREVFGHQRTLPIGAAFGVITVLGPKAAGPIEVATFRNDSGYSDGRRPDAVIFSTMEEDASRRDFTINGVFFDPLEEQYIDFVGGQADLQRGVVRAIGNAHERFAEDKLRMLRAVRFASNLEFVLELETHEAIKAHAADIKIVSAERIGAEMRRMLAHRHRAQATRLLWETTLLPQILPESEVFADPTVFHLTLAVMEKLPPSRIELEESLLLGLSALLHKLVDSKQASDTSCRRWRLSNDETKRTAWLLGHYQQAIRADSEPWPLIQRILIQPDAELLVELAESIVAARVSEAAAFQSPTPASDESLKGIVFCRERLSWTPERLNPAPLIGGDDLKQAGVEIGPLYHEILNKVRDLQLLGEIATTEEALEVARQISKQQRRT